MTIRSLANVKGVKLSLFPHRSYFCDLGVFPFVHTFMILMSKYK